MNMINVLLMLNGYEIKVFKDVRKLGSELKQAVEIQNLYEKKVA